MITEFTIQSHPHGLAIFGPIPASDLSPLIKGYQDRYDILDTGLAEKLGATLVLTTAALAKQWREGLDLRADHSDWLNQSGDTGVSSRTIYAVMTMTGQADGAKAGSPTGLAALHKVGADIPYDADDFGRCYRLLKRHPAWVARLGEVADRFPEWKPLVESWAELTALWELESPTGYAPKLDARLSRLTRSAATSLEVTKPARKVKA